MNPQCSSSDLRDVLQRLGTPLTKRRGQRLFEQDRAATGIYLIRSGHVALVAEQGCKKACTQVVGAGAVIGLPAVMATRTFSVTAEVIDDADLIFVSREVVLQTLTHSSELCMQALDVLGREVQEIRRILGAAKYAVN